MKLEIIGVGHCYGHERWALRDLTLGVGPGVLGLLGPNGAGKTTLMRILATVMRPTAGTVTWDGVDVHRRPDALRRVLGYLPQDFGVYAHLTAREFLGYLAAVRGLRGRQARQRIDELLETVNLHAAARMPLAQFSGGMKQRLGIAQALLNDPQFLIVDEPTAGLDPGERVRFRNLLGLLGAQRIVILSTHIVSDVEAVAGQVALIEKGQLLKKASPQALLSDTVGRVWSLTVPAAEVQAIAARCQISGSIQRPDGVQLRLISQARPAAEAAPASPTLEDAYLYHLSLAGAGQVGEAV